MIAADAVDAVNNVPQALRLPGFGWRVLLGMVLGLLFAAAFPPLRLPLLLPVVLACLLTFRLD